MGVEKVDKQSILFAWLLLAALIILDATGLWCKHVSVDDERLRATLWQASALFAIFCISGYRWPSSRITNLLHASTITWIYLAATLVLSYVAAAWDRPLIDAYLVKADEVLGIDWLGFYTWAKSHPDVFAIMALSYNSFLPQTILLQLFLNLKGLVRRSWELVWISVIACLMCILFSGIWPAVGAFGYFHVSLDTAYLAEFKAIHEGTMRTIGIMPVQGLITFPSFHAAMAIIYIYAARGIADLFPALVVLNVAMLFSIPVMGGHFFADEWGGILVALLSIGVYRAVSNKQLFSLR